MKAAADGGTIEQRGLVERARAFNDAWNRGDIDAVMAFFTDDATVRIVPPMPPEPELYSGTAEIRAWVSRTLSVPFQVETSNYRSVGSVVTWNASFPLEGTGGADDVSEAVFEGDRIHDFIP